MDDRDRELVGKKRRPWYLEYFTDAPGGWRCRRCSLVVARNAAGANSHLVKHVRRIVAARSAEPPR